jgi:hypothetical protein
MCSVAWSDKADVVRILSLPDAALKLVVPQVASPSPSPVHPSTARGAEFKVSRNPNLAWRDHLVSCASASGAACDCAALADAARAKETRTVVHVPPAMPALTPDEHERATADLRPLNVAAALDCSYCLQAVCVCEMMGRA